MQLLHRKMRGCAIAATVVLSVAGNASAAGLTLSGASLYDINASRVYSGHGWDTTGQNGVGNLYLLSGAGSSGTFLNSGDSAATSISMDISAPGTYTFFYRSDANGFNWLTPSSGLNLFFNDNTNPGISVVAKFNAVSPPLLPFENSSLGNKSNMVMGANSLSFSTNSSRVTLTNFSMIDYRNPAVPVQSADLVGLFNNTSNRVNDYSGSFTLNVAAIPEPEQWMMMMAGMALMGFIGTRRRQRVRLDPAQASGESM